MPRAMLPVPMMVMSMVVSSGRGEAECDVPGVARDEVAFDTVTVDARANGIDVGLRRHLHGPAVQTDGVLGRRRDSASLPDIDRDVMVVAAGGKERRGTEVGLELEAEDVAVERHGALDVADMEMQMADAQALADLCGRRLAVDGRQQRV